MIARIWHGTTEIAKAESYLTFLKDRALPDYRNTKGNLGAYLLRRADSEKAHFLTLSFWQSLEAVKSFAGEAYEQAHYYAEDKDFLLEFEPTVQHYELFD